YSLLVAILAVWLVFQRRLHLEQHRPRLRRGTGLAVVAVCAAGAALEWQWRSMPRLERDGFPRLYVIGDLISAGMTHDERTWPTMLAGERGVEVRDLSRAGETLDSAMSQLRGVEPGPAIVLLEIGGNDLLAGKPVTEFEEDLEQLLKRVQHPERRLVMFELPLPFMTHRHGWAQRRLSEEFSV